MGAFDRKVALVTGAASGIGAATARLLAERGATVIAADVADVGAQTLNGTEVHYRHLDVSDPRKWGELIQEIEMAYGGLHILVNSAGTEGRVITDGFETCSDDDWHQVMRVNLDGTFFGCRAALPAMKRHGGGAIVNLSSVASYYPTLYSIPYGASKGAVTQLTKTVALAGAEGDSKVRCNSVHPGVIITRMTQNIGEQLARATSSSAAGSVQSYASRIPMGAPGTPEQVAALIAFLASDEAGYITGGEYTVDGGSRLMR